MMKFYGRVLSSTRKNWLNFGGDLGIVRWVNEQKNTVIVVAYPDRGAGNNPELFFFFFRGVGSLSQPRLNIFTVGNMRVMICLGQGGLPSLSASSSISNLLFHSYTNFLYSISRCLLKTVTLFPVNQCQCSGSQEGEDCTASNNCPEKKQRNKQQHSESADLWQSSSLPPYFQRFVMLNIWGTNSMLWL